MMPGETHSKPGGIASEAAGTCQNCTALQQSLNEYVAALIALKQKIIDSDHLLTEYQQKCDELQFSERENETLRRQLEQMLQKISPQDQNQEQLQSLRAELEEKMSSLKIFQQSQVEYTRVKEECAKSDVAKKKLALKVKKMEEAAAKQIQDFKQLKLEKKVLAKELKKTQKKLFSYQKVKSTKAVKNAQTQIASREHFNVDKRKIKLLLEELWGCIDSRDKKQNELQVLDDDLNRTTEREPRKERNLKKSRKQKSDDDCIMPPSHSSPLILSQMLTAPAVPVIHASHELNTDRNEKNKSFEDAVADFNGDSAFYEDKTTDLFVPRDLIDSYEEASVCEDSEVDAFLAIMDWAKPLPPLLSPVCFSPSTSKDDLFGEFTDSSEEERICHSNRLSANDTFEYVNKHVNSARVQVRTDVSHTPTAVLENVKENATISVENVNEKTLYVSENSSHNNEVIEMSKHKKGQFNHTNFVLQAESAFYPVSNILPDPKGVTADYATTTSYDTESKYGQKESSVMQTKDQCVFSGDKDVSECNASGILEKPSIGDTSCSKSVPTDNLDVTILSESANTPMIRVNSSLEALQEKERPGAFVNESVGEESISAGVHDPVKSEDVSCQKTNNLELQHNLGKNAPISNADEICNQESLLVKKHDILPVPVLCVNKQSLNKPDRVSELLVQTESFPNYETAVSQSQRDHHKMLPDDSIGHKIHTDERQENCTKLVCSGEPLIHDAEFNEMQHAKDNVSIATSAQSFVGENPEFLGNSPIGSICELEKEEHKDGSMEWDTTNKENHIQSELVLQHSKSTMLLEQVVSVLKDNDHKPEGLRYGNTTSENTFISGIVSSANQDDIIHPNISCDKSNDHIISCHLENKESDLPQKLEIIGENRLLLSPESPKNKVEFGNLNKSVTNSYSNNYVNTVDGDSGTEDQAFNKQRCIDQNKKKDEYLPCNSSTSSDNILNIAELNSSLNINITHDVHPTDHIEHIPVIDNVMEEKSDNWVTESIILQKTVKAINSLHNSPVNEITMLAEKGTSDKSSYSSCTSTSDILETLTDCENFSNVFVCSPVHDKPLEMVSLHRSPEFRTESNIPPHNSSEGSCEKCDKQGEKTISPDRFVCSVSEHTVTISKTDSVTGETAINVEKEKQSARISSCNDTDEVDIKHEIVVKTDNSTIELVVQASSKDSSVKLLPANNSSITTDINSYTLKENETQVNNFPVQSIEKEVAEKSGNLSIVETFSKKIIIAKDPSDSSEESEDEFPLRKVNYRHSLSYNFCKTISSIKSSNGEQSNDKKSTSDIKHTEANVPPEIAIVAESPHDSKIELHKLIEAQEKATQSKNIQINGVHCDETSNASMLSDLKAARNLDQKTVLEHNSVQIISLEVSAIHCVDMGNNPLNLESNLQKTNANNSSMENPEENCSDRTAVLPKGESDGQQYAVVSLSDHLQADIDNGAETNHRRPPGKNLIWNFEISDDIVDPRAAHGTSKRQRASSERYEIDHLTEGPSDFANSVQNTTAGKGDRHRIKSGTRSRSHVQNNQIGQTVLANADTSTKTELSSETLHKVRSEMGPPLPPLLGPLIATPPRYLCPLSPGISSSSRSSLPSPLDDLISPLRVTPVLPLMSPLSENKRYKSPMFTTPSPSEKANRRILSSPLQFCAATPKHALPVPGRLPPSAAANSAPNVQANSVKILDTMYPELSARARTLNILKGNIQLNRCLPGDSKCGMPVNQITGFKAITSTSTAFIKTGCNSKSNNKDKPKYCDIQRLSNNSISMNKRVVDCGPMPKSAKRLRLDSESPVTETIKDGFSPPGNNISDTFQNADNFVPSLSMDNEVMSYTDEDIVANALKKVEELCFDLLPVIRSHIHVGTIPCVPVMRNEEKEVIHEFISTKKSLVDNILFAILKKLKTEKTLLNHNYLQALCRVYVGLCRQLGDMERARLLCYNILKEGFPEADKLVLFIISTWSDIFSLHGVVSKAMQALLKQLAEGEVLNCLSAYLNWEKTPPVTVDIVLSGVLMAIQFCPDIKFQPNEKFGEELTENIWEYVFAIDLLCCHQKWIWTNDNVISKELWPILDKWVRRKKGNINIAFVPDIVVAAVLRIVGHLCRMGLKEGFVTHVKNVGSVIIGFIKHAKEEDMPWGVQLAAVYLLIDLAPSDPAVVYKTLQTWRSTATHSIPPAVTIGLAEVLSMYTQEDKNTF
ncbi:little elongation complex subunit 1 [Discoglossus pictus]